jgi:hypothetical protein
MYTLRVGFRYASASLHSHFYSDWGRKQRYVAYRRRRRSTSSTVTTGTPTTIGHTNGSQSGLSPHGGPAYVHTTPQVMSGQAGSWPLSMHGGQRMQAIEGYPSQTYGQHLITTDNDSYSDDGIEGSWHKFLDKICFPCGHYEDI